jgi:hypothetical protein
MAAAHILASLLAAKPDFGSVPAIAESPMTWMPGMHLGLEGVRIHRAPALVVGQAGGERDLARGLRRNEVHHIGLVLVERGVDDHLPGVDACTMPPLAPGTHSIMSP